MGEFLTVEQVAERLNVGASTVRDMLRDGTLPGVKIPPGTGRWRIDAAELATTIEQWANRPAPEQGETTHGR